MPTVQAVLWHTILLLAYIHDEQHHLPGPAGFIFRTRTYSAAAANEQGVSSIHCEDSVPYGFATSV